LSAQDESSINTQLFQGQNDQVMTAAFVRLIRLSDRLIGPSNLTSLEYVMSQPYLTDATSVNQQSILLPSLEFLFSILYFYLSFLFCIFHFTFFILLPFCIRHSRPLHQSHFAFAAFYSCPQLLFVLSS
jgi:hypothetical protein